MNENLGPGMGALMWTALKIKCGWLKSDEPKPAREPRDGLLKRLDSWLDNLSDGAGAVLCLAVLALLLFFAVKAFSWAGPGVGAAGMRGWCSVSTCEIPKIKVAKAQGLSGAQIRALEELGVKFPEELSESREAGNPGVGLGAEEVARFLNSIEQASQAAQKEARDKDDALVNSAFSRAVLSGQSVEQAKKEASLALAKLDAQERKTRELFEAGRSWAAKAPQISADWASVMEAVSVKVASAKPSSMGANAWALRQTRWSAAAWAGMVWLVGVLCAAFLGAKAWKWGASKARAAVERDRERLTREWEKAQLGACARKKPAASARSSRL